MIGELAQQVGVVEHACRRRLGRLSSCQHLPRDRLHLAQAVVDADRLGAGKAALDAVVLRGVVRGSEHRTRNVHLS